MFDSRLHSSGIAASAAAIAGRSPALSYRLLLRRHHPVADADRHPSVAAAEGAVQGCISDALGARFPPTVSTFSAINTPSNSLVTAKN